MSKITKENLDFCESIDRSDRVDIDQSIDCLSIEVK